jgi:hypothetical protein
MITNYIAMSKNEDLIAFRDYVHLFYGKDGVYDLGCSIPDIEVAIMDYMVQCANIPKYWGGGDSVDRERVREILESKGFQEIAA